MMRRAAGSVLREKVEHGWAGRPSASEVVSVADNNLLAIGLVAEEEGVRLGCPGVGDHGEEVVGQMNGLAVGEDAHAPHGMDLENTRVRHEAVVGALLWCAISRIFMSRG